MENLSNIFMTSGVNKEGEGFVTVSAHGDKGTILAGQLSPDEIRDHALAYLTAAEAADQDAAVYRVIVRLDIPEPERFASMIITELRKHREE